MTRTRRLARWLSVLAAASLLVGGATLALAGPGDTPSEAVTLPASGQFSGTAAPQKTVWYRFFYANPSTTATIQYDFTPPTAAAGLDVYQQAADGTLIKVSSGTKTGSSVTGTFNATTAQWVYFTVVNSDPSVTFAYVGSATPVGATPTPLVTPTPTPVPPCIGDERISFNPATPLVGQQLVVTVTSSKAHVNVRLEGPDNPSGPSIRSEGGTYIWEWRVVPTTAGDRTYQFFVENTVLCASGTVSVGLPSVPIAPPLPHDARYFPETRFRIENEAIWQYFNARGGLDIFGFPVSRTFTFLGCPVQFFQRQIAQVCPGRGVALMNVLDPDIFSYTRVNFSTFPAADDALKAATPKVGEPDYAARIIEFVRAVAPDVWDGQRVNFQQTFFGLITPEQAGTDDPGLLALLNLEVWGAPISYPARDPNNASFVYQRFQRGIMHYDAVNQVTRGILLADYLKQVIRNSAELPLDLRHQAQSSRYFAQYCPGQPGWLCRPSELPGTDLTFAFEEG